MDNYSIGIEKNNETGKTEIVLEGQLVVLNSHEIRSKLQSLKGITNEILLKLQNVDDIDLSFIQILKAFEVEQAKKGIAIHYEFDMISDLQILLTQTGVMSILNK